MARQLLKQFTLTLLALVNHALKLMRDYISRRWKQALAKPREQSGLLPQKSSWPHAAIVNVRTDSHSLPFVSNLLSGLAENGFFVLVVTAGNLAPAFKIALLSHCHFLLERFSIVPDNSSKAGWDWIKQRDDLKNIDTLAFVSDAFYYPRHIASTIPQMLGQEGGWLSLFDITRSTQRAKNSFQIFRLPVFSSDAFENFWKNYALNTERLRAMANGEGDLAGALLKAGLAPQAYYNAERLCADVVAALDNENVPAGLRDVVNLTLGYERCEKNNRGLPHRKDALALPPDEIATRISALAEKNDPAQAIGLLCNYLYQAPLKRDIGRNGLDAKDLIELAQGFSTEEKEVMTKDLQGKTTANLSGMRKIPQRFMRMARSA